MSIRPLGARVEVAFSIAATWLALSSLGIYAAPARQVTTCAAMGRGSLAAQVAAASPDETVTFAVDCPTADPIKLDATLTLAKNIAIDGSGHNVVVVGPPFTSPNTPRGGAFAIARGARVVLTGLAIGHGQSAYGGTAAGIDNAGSAMLREVVVSDNVASRFGAAGGGINNSGSMTITGSTIDHNRSTYGKPGGGIQNTGFLTIVNSTVSDNTADGPGGGINNDGGTLTVAYSTIIRNSGGQGAGGIAVAAGREGGVTISDTILAANCPPTPENLAPVRGATSSASDLTDTAISSLGSQPAPDLANNGAPPPC